MSEWHPMHILVLVRAIADHVSTGYFFSNISKKINKQHDIRNSNLIQNSQAVKKVCGPQKGYGEKRCEIQGGGQEMAVMVG